jgi:hypothetical protein
VTLLPLAMVIPPYAVYASATPVLAVFGGP